MAVNDQVKLGAEILRNQFTVGEHGVANVDKEWAEKFLEGSDVTMEMVEKVQKERDRAIASAGLALGETGLAEFQKNKDLAQVSVELKFGKDTIGGNFYKTKSLPDGDGGMKDRHGVLSMSYKADGQIGSKGQLKKVKQELSEKAASIASS